MKSSSTQVTTQGNISAPSVVCAINEAGLASVLSTLNNLYTNKNLAVLREYSANARDSHVEAGQSRPIEVTLPTPLQPTFLVQDYGTGLTKDEILNVFGAYGSSTKRDTNELIGALGLGSKAAFTLGQQFIVTGVKEGRKTVVLFALDERSLPTMTVIADEVPTTEPNGVLISLAVESVHSFNEEAEVFFSHWERGTVLVDGNEPKPVWESAKQINEHTYVTDEGQGVFVIMGAIAYRVDNSILRSVRDGLDADSTAYQVADALSAWYASKALLIKVEIGDVDIAPSREALRDTHATIAAITQRVEEIADTLTVSVQEAVNAEPNALAGILTFEALREQFAPLKVARKDITYHGLRLSEVTRVILPSVFLRCKSYRGEATIVTIDSGFTDVSVKDASKALVVRLSKGENIGQVARLAKRFLEESEYTRIFVTDIDAASFGWFTFGSAAGGAPVWDLAKYRAESKALRAVTVSTRREPSYRTGWGYSSSRERVTPLSEILEEGNDIVIWASRCASVDKLSQEALADYTIVRLFGPQTDSYVRKQAEAAGVTVWSQQEALDVIVPEYVKSKVAVATEDEQKALGARTWLAGNVRYGQTEWENFAFTLGPEEIESPLFLAAYSTVKVARILAASVTDERANELRAAEATEISFEADLPEVSVDFPMLDAVHIWDVRNNETLREHVLDYINLH